jgi:hypothetical protein
MAVAETTREILRYMGAASAAQEAGDREAEDQAWWRCIELDDGSDARSARCVMPSRWIPTMAR